MNKIKVLSLVLMISIGTFFVITNYELVNADENTELIKVEGVNFSDEFLKALSNPETGNGLVGSLDYDGDGILSLEEIKYTFSLRLDLSNCTITDWSDLKNFEYLCEFKVVNADFEKCSFNNIDEFCAVYYMEIKNSINCEKLKGLDKFTRLRELYLYSNDIISCESFTNVGPLVSLHIENSTIINIAAMDGLEIENLYLNDSSFEQDKLALPLITGLRYLDISNSNITEFISDSEVHKINASHNNINFVYNYYTRLFNLDLRWNYIKNIDWYIHRELIDAYGNPISEREINLYGNPLDEESIIEILDYNYNMSEAFTGKEGTAVKLSMDDTSPFKWLKLSLLRFESEDESVARITDDTVELLKEGTTNVNVYYNNGASENDLCLTYHVKVTGEGGNTEIPTETPSVSPTDAPVLIGDVNKDDLLDAADALEILKMSAKLIEEDSLLADITMDGMVNAVDALQVLKIAAKLI